jgi:hypothetical protein
VFQDKDWIKKVLIGSLLLISILGIPALFGYYLRISRRLIVDGIDTPLPEWQNIGELWTEGIRSIPVYLFWFIPAMLLGIFQWGETTAVESLLAWIVGLICNALAAIAIINVAISGRMSAGFQISDIVNRLTGNLGSFFIVFLLTYVLSIIAGLGILLCVIGVLATSVYAFFGQAHLWAQAYRRTGDIDIPPPSPRF